nr:hypothetical protein [Vibrio vulnificus]
MKVLCIRLVYAAFTP